MCTESIFLHFYSFVTQVRIFRHCSTVLSILKNLIHLLCLFQSIGSLAIPFFFLQHLCEEPRALDLSRVDSPDVADGTLMAQTSMSLSPLCFPQIGSWTQKLSVKPKFCLCNTMVFIRRHTMSDF